MSELLLIRADAGSQMGTGHVMRCLALAQRWRRTGPVLFATARCTPALEELLSAEGFEIRKLEVEPGGSDDARAVGALGRQLGSRWVAVDGYQFSAEYQRTIKAAGLRLLFFDDYGHAGDYCADIVLNQNLGAEEAWYARRANSTRLLLGPRYAVLRSEFLARPNESREISQVARKVLVTLGGADPDNVTGKVVAALRQLSDVEAVVVVGGSNPHRALLEAAVDGQQAIRLVVNPSNIAPWMAWADVAVAAGGTTSWELALMGLPSIVLVLAENQAAIAVRLDRAGVSICLGDHRQITSAKIAFALRELLNDVTRREAMSRAGRELVDGCGAARVAANFKAADVVLRQATEEDGKTIWQWANDPAVRAASFAADPIDWESHISWFKTRLLDRHGRFYLALNGVGQSIGQIRFERGADEQVVVSVSLASVARGKDWGAAVILRGARQLFAETNVPSIHAYIKPGNRASVRAFQTAGFAELGPGKAGAVPALHFVLRRDES